MTQTISRMYSSKAQAMKAADELGKNNYPDVHVISGPAPAAEGQTASGPTRDDVMKAMSKAHILNAHAKIYADRIMKGGTLVTAHTLFGRALEARNVLDSHGPADSGVPDPVFPAYVWDEKTPTSSAMSLPLLAKTSLPAQKLFGVPSLTKKPAYFSSCLGMGLLSNTSTPLSSSFGMSTLSKNATPFSSKFGMPLLSKKK